MDQSNEQLIRIGKICMIMAGYWRKPFTTNKTIQNIYFFYSIFIHFAYLMLWSLLFAELVRLKMQNYDSVLVFGSLAVVVNATRVFVKIVIFRANNVLDLYDDIVEKEREIWNSDSDVTKTIYKGYVKICRTFMICQVTFTSLCITALAIMGVVGDYQLIQYNKANNASLETHFWYQIWFPGNKLENRAWMYSLNTIFSYTATVFNSITHMIVVTLFIFAASQLNVLRYRISQYDSEPMTNAQKLGKLKEFIGKHLYLIRFVHDLNGRTKNVLLMEFLLCSVDISSVVVNLAKETSLQSAFHFGFFLLLFMQIFFMSWTANEIKVQSELFAEGIYETNWYDLDKTGAHYVNFLILRSQRPLLVTIGAFGPMTTETGLTILKAAYSYVSIMKE